MPRGAPKDAWEWDPATRRSRTFKVPDWVYRLRLYPPHFRERPEIPVGRRKEFAEVLQRMAGLGLMAKEVQEALKAGAAAVDEVQSRMQRIADEAADIGRIVQEKEMDSLHAKLKDQQEQEHVAKVGYENFLRAITLD